MLYIARSLGERGVRTKFGKLPENRWVDYMLQNPIYIGKIRWTPDGNPVSKRIFDDEKTLVVDGNHEPIISMELWEKVQKLRAEQKAKYPKYAKRQQPINYMLKGLVRCSNCDATLAASSYATAKGRAYALQCCNYTRASCFVSHHVSMKKIESAFIQGLKQAIGDKNFPINPKPPKKTNLPEVDYDKLIAVEEKRLARAKDAYLAEIDTIEQYKQNKNEITAKIEDLKARRDKETVQEIDVNAFAKKVKGIVEFIEREDVTPEAKNEALHTIIEKVVYEKAKNNLAIYFHEI